MSRIVLPSSFFNSTLQQRFKVPLASAQLMDGPSEPLRLRNPKGFICRRNPKVNLVSTRHAMVAAAGPTHLMGSLTKIEGLRFAVIVARFNEVVTNLLLEGALETFRRYSVREEDITVVKVPGSFEIPVVAQKLGKSGKYHAIICIGAVTNASVCALSLAYVWLFAVPYVNVSLFGVTCMPCTLHIPSCHSYICLIRGDTTHYDAVANSAASGVLSASIGSGIPCIFGVLTCEDMDQALNRAGGKAGNKGAEAALTAIEMASLFEHHLK